MAVTPNGSVWGRKVSSPEADYGVIGAGVVRACVRGARERAALARRAAASARLSQPRAGRCSPCPPSPQAHLVRCAVLAMPGQRCTGAPMMASCAPVRLMVIRPV